MFVGYYCEKIWYLMPKSHEEDFLRLMESGQRDLEDYTRAEFPGPVLIGEGWISGTLRGFN